MNAFLLLYFTVQTWSRFFHITFAQGFSLHDEWHRTPHQTIRAAMKLCAHMKNRPANNKKPNVAVKTDVPNRFGRPRSSPHSRTKRLQSSIAHNQNAPDMKSQLSLARNGHACIRQLLDRSSLDGLESLLRDHAKKKELEAWRQKVEVAATTSTGSAKEAAELAMSCRTTTECRKRLTQLLGDDVPIPFLQFFNCWREIPQIMELARNLAPIAAKLLDVKTVRLYQDSVFWKRSVDGPTPWHADAPMAPFDTSLMVTAWIPLQEVVNTSGLVFASKSHADYSLLYWKNGNEKDARNEDLSTRYSTLVDYMPLRLGDVTFHSGWTLHCADGGEDRVALAITFVDSRAPIRANLCAGDDEDAWSYRDWINQVPRATCNWDHPLAPVL